MKKILLSGAAVVLLSGCQQVQDWSGDLFGQKQETEKVKEDQDLAKDQKKTSEPEENEKGTGQDDSTNENQEEIPPELLLEGKFFNKVEVVDGKKVIQNPANILALVNKEFALGEYKPDDLVRPNVPFLFGNQDLEKAYIRQDAATALENMFAEAKKQNIELVAVSGYRSYDYQEMLLEREIQQFGKEKAVKAVAPPGQSEHQSGLAMDISSESNDFQIDIAFGQTVEGKWLSANAHKFGFILRYPEDKVDITLYQYEPWHFRYVGKEAAKVIYENEWTLEEYFQNVKEI
ncbi:M15 family metallopeptidase [Bacillus seohaeanensis]|jgi:zinc D-Ala-D-Ala carboxypeptidase|uniref:D-alanyl-D-alanine carboxypeptidase family protein n=1 Tax=Bacillus seohaeanensis TaxID=284580 RepID=A0ABW5RR11_9BACI